jgi:hypothetical protein
METEKAAIAQGAAREFSRDCVMRGAQGKARRACLWQESIVRESEAGNLREKKCAA